MKIEMSWIITLDLPNETLVLKQDDSLENIDNIKETSLIRRFETKKDAIFYARHTLGDTTPFNYEKIISWR
jgi:hypothetical protein